MEGVERLKPEVQSCMGPKLKLYKALHSGSPLSDNFYCCQIMATDPYSIQKLNNNCWRKSFKGPVYRILPSERDYNFMFS